MNFYRQCKLIKEKEVETSWIPEKHAVEGKFLEIKRNGVKSNGWLVTEVFNRCSEDQLKFQVDGRKTLMSIR